MCHYWSYFINITSSYFPWWVLLKVMRQGLPQAADHGKELDAGKKNGCKFRGKAGARQPSMYSAGASGGAIFPTPYFSALLHPQSFEFWQLSLWWKKAGRNSCSFSLTHQCHFIHHQAVETVDHGDPPPLRQLEKSIRRAKASTQGSSASLALLLNSETYLWQSTKVSLLGFLCLNLIFPVLSLITIVVRKVEC